MSEQPIQDINDGKPWSEMDLFDLRNSLRAKSIKTAKNEKRRKKLLA
ncbi:MAG TPA: hypothetical protein VI009_21580 [Xanthobacteraceae bacterium]|jgi:hypothetical protein